MITKRDPLDIFIGWTIAISLTLLAACVSILSPLAYLWLMGIAGILMTFGITGAAITSLTSDGSFLGFLMASEVLKLGFQAIGAILAALADASK